MNPILAEMFDTHGYREKIAHVRENVEFFLKVAHEEGVDLSGYSEDEIVEMANDLEAQLESEQSQYPDYDPQYVEGAENIGPKTAEADWLGRYMAHAMYNEQEKIAKQGFFSKAYDKTKSGLTEFGKRLGGGRVGEAEKGLAKLKERGSQLQSGEKRILDSIQKSKPTDMRGWIQRGQKQELLKGIKEKQKSLGKEVSTQTQELGKHKSQRNIARGGLAAGIAGAGALGTYAATKKSHLSDLDDLAIEKANLLLELAQDGEHVTFDKVASYDESDLDRIVTELAWSYLESEGYV